MGVHHSTYYRYKRQVDRWGLEVLRVRERRRPRMPNEIGPHLEQRIVSFSLAHPGFGPRLISAELAREKWGGLRICEHGIWRVLCRVGLNTRGKRRALVARHRDPYERAPSPAPPERHIEASEPGEGASPRTRARLAGWKLRAVSTDNGSEFVSGDFRAAVEFHGATQRRIKAGRPTQTAVSSVCS
jgi:transposase InsO family protein